MSDEYVLVAEKKLLSKYDDTNEIVKKDAHLAKEQGRLKYEDEYNRTHTPLPPDTPSVKEKRTVPFSPHFTSSNYIIRYIVPGAPYIEKAEVYSIEKKILPPTIINAEYYTLHKPDAPLFVSVEEKTIIKTPPVPKITGVNYVTIYSDPVPPHITNAKTFNIAKKDESTKSAEKQIKLLRYTLRIKRGDYNRVTLKDLDTDIVYNGKLNGDLTLFSSDNPKVEFLL